MKDAKWVVLFVVIGLALAHFVGSPLRKDASKDPVIGTPLDNAKVYAEGIIDVPADLKATVKNHPALFLFARAEGSRAPIAVKRLVSPAFPLSFRLTETDNMAGEGFYEGDITVVARLDQDGAAGPKQPMDYEGSVAIKAGADRQVRIEIDR